MSHIDNAGRIVNGVELPRADGQTVGRIARRTSQSAEWGHEATVVEEAYHAHSASNRVIHSQQFRQYKSLSVVFMGEGNFSIDCGLNRGWHTGAWYDDSGNAGLSHHYFSTGWTKLLDTTEASPQNHWYCWFQAEFHRSSSNDFVGTYDYGTPSWSGQGVIRLPSWHGYGMRSGHGPAVLDIRGVRG